MDQKIFTSIKNLSDEALAIEFKKRKSDRTFAAFFVGMFIGIAVWSSVKNGIGFFIFLPFLVAYFFRKVAANYKEIDDEIVARKNVFK